MSKKIALLLSAILGAAGIILVVVGGMRPEREAA